MWGTWYINFYRYLLLQSTKSFRFLNQISCAFNETQLYLILQVVFRAKYEEVNAAYCSISKALGNGK